MTADYARTRIEEAVCRAIDMHAPSGETWFYDIGPVTIQIPAGTMVGYGLILTCRNIMLTPKWLAISDIIPDGFPPDEMVEATVRSCVDQLMKVRDNARRGQQ
jgi:hypothetical protein